MSMRVRCGWGRRRAFLRWTTAPSRCVSLQRTKMGFRPMAFWRWPSDQQGRLWVGTNGGGVLNYDGHTFHAIRLGKSVQMNTIEAILCDRQGRLWFGTTGWSHYVPAPRCTARYRDPVRLWRVGCWASSQDGVLSRGHGRDRDSFPRHPLRDQGGADALQSPAGRLWSGG